MAGIRVLTNDVYKRITYFYATPFYTNHGLMFTLCFGLPFVVVAFILAPLVLAILVVIIWLGIFALIISARLKKIKKAKEVYEFGNEETIRFEGLSYNYSIKVNGAPQPVIQISKNGETINIKSFSERVIKAFSTPVQKAYVMDKYPDIILPETLFEMDLDSAFKKQQSRSINI